MEDDKWRLENTWSGDQSQKMSLKGTIENAKISFILTETDVKTEKVLTKSFEGTMDEARISMQGKWWSDNDPQKQDFTFNFYEEISFNIYNLIDGKSYDEEVMLDLKHMTIRRKTEEEQL